jgi:hypothetical protein
MDEIFSVFKEFLPFITAGGMIILAVGLVPRVGPGRAVWIALRSRSLSSRIPSLFASLKSSWSEA